MERLTIRRTTMSFSRQLKSAAERVWEDGYRHPFVQGLGSGALEKDSFKFYLIQDYKYLLKYAKVFALGALKADSESLMAKFTRTQNDILNMEMNLHRAYMKSFDISEEEAESAKSSLFNNAYTANMLAEGYSGGCAEIIAAVFPCGWTYYDYAVRLKEDYSSSDSNFYKSWLDMYSSDEFKASFDWFFEELDRLCESKSPAELEKITEIFVSSVEFEYLFWDMSYKKQISYDR